MPVALVPYVGSGTEADPFRPDILDGGPSIDLRPDSSHRAGWALVSTAVVPVGGITLGVTLDSAMSGKTKKDAGTVLGVTVASSTPRALLPELLVTHATSTGPRWKPVETHRRADGKLVRQIWLGEMAWEQIIEGGPGAMLSESFDTADSTTLGPGQTWTEVVGDWQVKTNAAEAVGTGANVAVVSTDLTTGDHRAVVTVTKITGSPGVLIRASGTSHSGYFGHIVASDGTRRLAKVVNGTFTVLASATGTVPTLPVRFQEKVEGSALSLLDDAGNVTVGPITDTTFDGTVRKVGIRVFGAGARLDDFVGQDLAAQAGSGTVVVTGTGTVAASGTRRGSGTAAVVGAGQVVATGRRGAQASAAVAGGGTVTVLGTRQGATTAAVSGVGAVSAVGAKASGASSALVTGAGSSSVAGVKASTSTAGVAGTGTVVVTGSASAPAAAGTALVVGVGSVSAFGAKGVGGAVATSGAGQVAASGRKGGAGLVGILGAGTAVVTGVKRDVLGTVGVTGAGSVAVAGSKRTGAVTTLFGTGGASVAALAARGGTASVAVLGLVQTTAGARFPIPIVAVVTLVRPGARISVSRNPPARSSGPSGSVSVSSGGATVGS